MNLCPLFLRFGGPRFLLRVCLPSFLITAHVAPAVAGEADVPAPKDHQVFVGLDVVVRQPAGEARIESVTGNVAEVVGHGAKSQIPLRKLGDLHMAREPVVSSMFATIADAKGRRTYSPAINPMVQASRNQIVMDSLQMDTREREAEAEIEGSATTAAIDHAPDFLKPQMAQRANDKANETSRLTSTNYSGTAPSALPSGESAALYDTFEASFVVSSTQVIENAYLVMLTVVRDPQDPRLPHDIVTFRGLPTIDATPRKVTVTQNGFPPGFGVDRYEIHMYVRGHEFATSLSDNRVELTGDEAFQFLLLSYTASHGTATLPPALAPEFVPADFRAHVPAGQMDRLVDVRIDETGNVAGVKLVPAGVETTDPAIESLIRKMRFFPALVAGKPVVSSGTFALGEFVR
jgi:hypothetical protein